jgi:hypothetical protein
MMARINVTIVGPLKGMLIMLGSQWWTCMGSAQVFILEENFHTLVTQKTGIKKKMSIQKKNAKYIWKIHQTFETTKLGKNKSW